MNDGYGQAVATNVARRTQAERTEATIAALVDAARDLFARRRLRRETSLDAVAARAGVTKGAVYHHFEGKQTALRGGVHARGRANGAYQSSPRTHARRIRGTPSRPGVGRSWTSASIPTLQRIVLLDASAAIGWEQIRRLESPLLEMMELAHFPRAIEAGRIAPPTAGAAGPVSYTAPCARPR